MQKCSLIYKRGSINHLCCENIMVLFSGLYIRYWNLWDRNRLNLFVSRRPCQHSSATSPVREKSRNLTKGSSDLLNANQETIFGIIYDRFSDITSVLVAFRVNAKRTCPNHLPIATQNYCLLTVSVVAITMTGGDIVVASEYVWCYNYLSKSLCKLTINKLKIVWMLNYWHWNFTYTEYIIYFFKQWNWFFLRTYTCMHSTA